MQGNNCTPELIAPHCPHNTLAPMHIQHSAYIGALHPAQFMPIHHNSSSTTPSTTSSFINTRLYTMPRLSTPIMSNDNLHSIPLFHGDYREKEEPSLSFAQFQLSLPDSYTDVQHVQ
jgi:hypothetical protein